MDGIGPLLKLLYNAHENVDGLVVEVRDWTPQKRSDVLMVERNAEGAVRMQRTGGGPDTRPAVTTRQLWFQRPDRLRVEVLYADVVVRAAARDGTAWWWWDREDGEDAGDFTQGAGLPALLDVPLLHPERLLSTRQFKMAGTGNRAGRKVLKARVTARDAAAQANNYSEFEFDLEHGTPLQIAAFDAGECIGLTEVLSIDYEPSFNPAVFRFAPRQGNRSVAGAPRRRRRSPELLPAGERMPVDSRAALPGHQTLWLTGLSGAGKTTIARATERLLQQLGAHCCVLDGDQLRQGPNSDLGLSREDRGEQARRTAHIAVILADSGVIPIVALISPYAEDRARAREIHHSAGLGFIEVWIDTPVAICGARDPKGLYAAASTPQRAAQAGGLPDGSGLTGVTGPYEAPVHPELRVNGYEQHPRMSAICIVQQLFATLAQCDNIGTS